MYNMLPELDVVIQKTENPIEKGEGEVNLNLGVNKKVKEICDLDEYRSDLVERYEKYTQDLGVEFTDKQRAALKYAVPAQINPMKSKENTDKFFSRLSPEMVAAQEEVAQFIVDENRDPLNNWAIYGSGSIDYDISGKRDDVDVFFDVLDAHQLEKNLKNSPKIFVSKEAKNPGFETSTVDLYGKTHKFSFWIETDVLDENGKKIRVEVEMFGEGATEDGKFAGTGQVGYKEGIYIDQRKGVNGTTINYMWDENQNLGYALYALKEALLENPESQKDPRNKAKLAARLIKFYEKGHKSIDSIIEIIHAAVASYPKELRTKTLDDVLSNEKLLVDALIKIRDEYENLSPQLLKMVDVKWNAYVDLLEKDPGTLLQTLHESKQLMARKFDKLTVLGKSGDISDYLDLMEEAQNNILDFEELRKYYRAWNPEGREVLFFIMEQYFSDFVRVFSMKAYVALDRIVKKRPFKLLGGKEREKYLRIKNFLHQYKNYNTVSLQK